MASGSPSDRRPEPRADGMDEEFWRDFLNRGGDTMMQLGRYVLRHIPADPRCRMCASPFAGPGAPIMRLFGKTPSPANPNWCNSCFSFMSKHHGGAEIEGAMLFADIRGSTSLAERMSTAQFHALLDRFYTTAARVVFAHDGFIDKFVGDELVALFFPLLTGEAYTARAVATARALLRETGHGDGSDPWVPLGAGVHSGRAWFGVIGGEGHGEMTAVGDAVNVAARLASAAGAGEVLVSADAAAAAGLDSAAGEWRTLTLRGKEERIEVVSLGAA